jgi:hypothetical protein
LDVKLRLGTPEDAEVCGRICYEAFEAIAGTHQFAPDFPDLQTGVGLLSMLLGHPGFYSVVAEVNGGVVGSNFLDERSTVVGVWAAPCCPDGYYGVDYAAICRLRYSS